MNIPHYRQSSGLNAADAGRIKGAGFAILLAIVLVLVVLGPRAESWPLWAQLIPWTALWACLGFAAAALRRLGTKP